MKQTRFKTVWFFGICLVVITIIAMIKAMPAVAVIGATGIAGIVAYYMRSETSRSSKR